MSKLCGILGLIFASQLAYASPDSSKVRSKHKDLFGNIDHISVQFNQSTYKGLRKKHTQRNGRASFSKPHLFVWQFQDDSRKETYFFNGKKLSHFQESENTVTHYGSKAGVFKELYQVVYLVLDGNKLFDTYNVSEIQNIKNQTLAKLLPKNETNSNIKLIEVKISDGRKYLKQLKIMYQNGDHTTFQFKNPRFAKIPQDFYVFKNPGLVKERQIK